MEGDPHQEETAEPIESAEKHLASVIEFNDKQMAKMENAIGKVEKSAACGRYSTRDRNLAPFIGLGERGLY